MIPQINEMPDWESSKNYALINPKFSAEQKNKLLSWVAEGEAQFKAHIFLLTSGTTAQSLFDLKWVALSKTAFLKSALQVNLHLQSDQSDVWLHPLPGFHVGGLGIWARSHLSGASVVQLDSWKIDEFMRMIEFHRVTLTALVPAQVYDLVNHRLRSPKCLRAIVVGGGALSSSLYQSARQLGWPVLPSYGMTEAASQIATASLSSLEGGEGGKGGKDGDEVPLMEVLSDLDVQETAEGRLKIKGESIFSAYIYWNAGRVVCVDPKVEGWFSSQDKGIREGKHLKISGRLGDFIKIGGESVELGRLRETLEQVQIQLSIGADIALLAVPDERLGHVIHLVSDAQLTSPDATRLIDGYNVRVLGFEKMRRWHVLGKLPRTELGKLIPSACLSAIQQGIN